MINNVYGFQNKQPVVWHHRDPTRSNLNCLYCGTFVGAIGAAPSDKEHLIAREFVPTNSLSSTSFNFIFRACKKCNNEKSNYERHVSTVCLFNSPARTESDEIDKIAKRKASNDFHPNKQGVSVANSIDKILVHAGPFRMEMLSPPQLKSEYVRGLALSHMQAFFSLVTTCNPTKERGLRLLPEKHFHLWKSYSHTDWGNLELLCLIERTKDWPCYCNVSTANDFFRVLMKQNPLGSDWFWALEWNKHLRVVGSISSSWNTAAIFKGLPALNWICADDKGKTGVRMRINLPLVGDDELFAALVEVT